MLGHYRPRGPNRLPQIFFSPAQWLGGGVRCAMVGVMVLCGLLAQAPASLGQRMHLRREAVQVESVQSDGLYQFDSTANSRWSIGNGSKKKQSRLLFARRSWLSSPRMEQRRIVNRPRLAEVIKSRDFSQLHAEGWQSMTVENDTPGLFQAYGQLPDRQFNDVPHTTSENLESLPVAVRQSQADQQLYFYLANASPWRLRVRLQLAEDVSAEKLKGIESLLQSKLEFTSNPDDAKALMVELGPYGLVGGSAKALGTIESYTFEYLDDVAADLRKRVFALQVKLQQAQQAEALRMLSNPKFLASKSTTSPIDGWEIGQQSLSRFKLINDSTGKKRNPVGVPKTAPGRPTTQVEPTGLGVKRMDSYLQIRSVAEETTWVRSEPITPTETNRLSISVWLRVSEDQIAGQDAGPEVRLAIDGRTPASEYYRFGVVRREPADSLTALGGKWKRFAVHFDDLPSGLTDLRIGFDVVGQGVVDVGQVELFDRWFDNSEAKAITQLLASADAMLRQPIQFDRCRRLLEEHWAVFLDDHFSLAPVPMLRPKVVETRATVADTRATVGTVGDKQKGTKQKNDDSKAGQSLNR